MITILGAGIGGLALAQILTKHRVPCVVYEADASASSRHQGGMLNINEETGQRALRSAGLFEAFEAKVLPGADALRLTDRDGAVLFSEAGNGARPEIDRGGLRQLYLEALHPDVVRWNRRVSKVERASHGFVITFADGSTETTPTLIGADGAWSRVRPLLSNVTPTYSGITFAEYRYLKADLRYPEFLELIGDGLFFALADERGVIAHREPGNELCVYAAVKLPELSQRQPLTREQMAEHFAGWGDVFQRLLRQGEAEPIMRPLAALPLGFRWQSAADVTLLGDAAHLMSPFAGEGVNLAMADAADLAQALLATPGDTQAAFAAYEAQMFARADEYAAVSASNLEMAFAADGGQRMLDFFLSVKAEAHTLEQPNNA